MSENTPENVSSELVDLGEIDYAGYDKNVIDLAVLHNLTRFIRSRISSGASNAMGLAMMRAFKLNPTPADYEKVLTDLMHINSVVQDMVVLIEELMPITPELKEFMADHKDELVSVIDKHPIVATALIRSEETADQKLDRAMRSARNRFPHNG